jgi:hypothetical protein
LIALLADARVTRAIRILFCAAVVVALLFALLPHPHDPFGTMWDKYKHMLVFAVLSVLAAFGWRDAPLPRIGERLSFLGALIEVFQSIPALQRDCDPKDWIADTLAIIVVLVAVKLSGLREVPQI